LQTKLFELEQQRRELSAQYTDAHPSVRLIDQQIGAVKKEISQITGQIKQLPDLEQQLLNLTRDVKVNGELYVNLLNSAQQLRLVKEGKVGNVRVVDTAVVPETPIKPTTTMLLTRAALLGPALGVGIALLRNMIRPGIKDPRDIEAALGMHVFATIPHSTPHASLHQLASERVAGNHVLAQISPKDPA